MEIWKELGINGKYLISNYGRVKSIHSYSEKSNPRKYGIREMIRKPQKDKDGYVFYCLDIGSGKKKTIRIHKEVFRYFISSDFTSIDQICHSDGDINNNKWSNLYKGNQRTNTLDKYRHGHTKLTIQQVIEIRNIGNTMFQKDIASKFNIGQNYVSRILSNKRCIYI
jgi:hypothetical protein